MSWANAGRVPPLAVGRGSATPTPQEVGGSGFASLGSPRSTPVAYDPRACRSILCRPTAYVVRTPHGMHLARLCCGPTRGAVLCMLSTEVRSHQHRDTSMAWAVKASDHRVRVPWRAASVLFAPWSKGQPPTEHARHAVRTWRGCVVGERRPCLSPRHRPRPDRTNTARGQRHRLRSKFLVTAFDSRGARPAHVSAHFVSADRIRSSHAA